MSLICKSRFKKICARYILSWGASSPAGAELTLFPIQCWHCVEKQIFHSTSTSYHYSDVIMGPMASQVTSLTIVYSTFYSGADQRKHQSSASLVFMRGIHRWPVKSPHKWPVMRKMFPFDDVIMCRAYCRFDVRWPGVVLLQYPWYVCYSDDGTS